MCRRCEAHQIVRFEEFIEDGKLSKDGKEGSGGLEAVVAGGMHTLAVDEAGKVSTGFTAMLHWLRIANPARSGHGVSTTMRVWAE